MSLDISTITITTTQRTWPNCYPETGYKQTPKNSKSTPNVLQVFESPLSRTLKTYKQIRCSPNAYKCPVCNTKSRQVRSRYTRRLMDLPSGGHRVSIVLEVRKFKCRNEDCIRKIFSERYPDYTKPYSRKTDRAVENLASILIEVSSRKGSYLTDLIQMKQSPSTCLRIVSRLPIPGYTDKKVIGIDDWAFRKGINYGSIIVDAETGRPIDLINSRGELEVTSWLKNHPEIDIVTRDRASSYSKAIRTALPSCIQIADKFHIVKNLSGQVYEVVRKQYTSIKAEFIESLDNSNNCSGQDTLENPTEILMKTNIPVNENEIPGELANKEASDTSLNIKGSTHYREELYFMNYMTRESPYARLRLFYKSIEKLSATIFDMELFQRRESFLPIITRLIWML